MSHDDRPRLVFLVTSHMTAARFLPGFVGHLAANGWRVTVICAPGEGLDRLAAIDGVDLAPVSMERDPSLLADARAVVQIRRLLVARAPHVVLTATPKAGLLETLAARSARVPVVVHLMWGLRSETMSGPRRAAVQALESVATRLSHHVVPCSDSLRRELVRRRMVDPRRAAVLGAGSSHGVELEQFDETAATRARTGELRALLNEVGSGPVVGFVGRLNPDKGVGDLVTAVELLLARGCSVRLLLIGIGEHPGTTALVRDARDRGLPLLWIPEEPDIVACYRAMDVHCLPSLREGFPNVCLEASVCGVPTVTTDATGAVDTVREGTTGAVARKGDAHSLADTLRPLLVDLELRQRLGRAARDWVESDFAAAVVWRRHENLLRGLLAGRAGTAESAPRRMC